eukprot:TRINITY_DN1781_c0_g1_i1.p1 TRINITY_DN1781_c0_g1~~TRINITY_DN1781_c0_g1_i1.p1  ORF type:complete len:482 (-),score=96.02 TRINITY_DN1781_c0_g1_i1:61-1506(-)
MESENPHSSEEKKGCQSLLKATYNFAYGYANAAYAYVKDRTYSPVVAKLIALHKYLTTECDEHSNIAEKGIKKTYSFLLYAIQKQIELLSAAKGKLGDALFFVVQKLSYIEQQLRVIYGPLLWNIQENYIAAMDCMNHYVLFARAFYDCYLISSREKKDTVREAFLGQVKALCQLAALPFEQDHEEKASAFFQETNNIWIAKKLELDSSKENEINALLTVLKKSVAVQLGLAHKSIGLGFYETYEALSDEGAQVELNPFIAKCKEMFPDAWSEEVKMKELAAEYYVFSEWRIEGISEESLQRYAATHTRLAVIQKLASRYVTLLMEKYLELYEFLVAQYYDEKISAYAGDKESKESEIKVISTKMEKLQALNSKALNIFGYYTHEAKSFVTTSKLYQWSASVCEKVLPLEFLKTNLLKVSQIGSTVISAFKEGMTIVYNRGADTISVVIDTVKSPSSILPELSKRFRQFKGAVVNLSLIHI